MKKLRISIDFDNTLVVSKYPKIIGLMDGAQVVNEWYENHVIIINTCRAGEHEEAAKKFLNDNGIKYHYLNENDPELIEYYKTDTRKISCDVNFDDRNAGGFMGWSRADKLVKKMQSQKPIILCVVGESGSGKTTLVDKIQSTYGITMIESYTTRPKRTPTETGHTFVTDEQFDAFSQEQMIAFTEFGKHRYCCLKSDVRNENTYVIDEKGLRYLRDNFSDLYEIHTLRVTCGTAERIQRAGKERVLRDEGKFTMRESAFEFVWRTDTYLEDSSRGKRRAEELAELDEFILKVFKRGWK